MQVRLLLLIVFKGFAIEFAFAQIQLQNSSFENGYHDCSVPVTPYLWNLCEQGIANCTLDTVEDIHPTYSVIDGLYILGIRTQGANYNGAISQFVGCGFKQNIRYQFSFWMSGFYNDLLPAFDKGKAQIWLGADTCSRDFKIFESDFLDTVWNEYTVSFIPDNDYSYFHICGLPMSNVPYANILVDSLSPIYMVNSHQVHAYQQDTTLAVGNSTCINLDAYTDVPYDTVWWEQAGAGIISNQLNAGIRCVDSNSTFIIHMASNDTTCAGRIVASDTVRVRFYNPNPVHELERASLKIYPNPSTKQLGFFVSTNITGNAKLYNTMGQLVSTTELIIDSNQISGTLLQSGIYQVVFELDNGDILTNRVTLQ